MTDVTIYTKPLCGYCHAAKDLLRGKGVAFTEIDVSRGGDALETMLARSGGKRTVPQIFIGAAHVGGCDDLYALNARGALDPLLKG